MNKRPTIMEVNLNTFKDNISKIKKKINSKELMPIIKANAYGTYINKCIDLIKEFNIVGVATVEEGVYLRENGYDKDIFILNQPAIEEINSIIEYHLTTGISSVEFLKELKIKDTKVKIHLEIETGMNRTGINPIDLNNIFEILKNSNISVEGIYTHLSSADTDKEYTLKQLDIFKKAVAIAKENINEIKYIHALASTGILKYLDNETNLVRPGIIMYGYDSFEDATKELDLKPICTLKSKIVYLKTVPENTPISYSKTYITEKKTKVATIPIGYADGLKRCLSNKGYVVVNNKKCKIIGNICMDSCMIDVTEIDDVQIGTDVYIWDNNIITVDDIARECNTINYEILSTISSRVERVFINK